MSFIPRASSLPLLLLAAVAAFVAAAVDPAAAATGDDADPAAAAAARTSSASSGSGRRPLGPSPGDLEYASRFTAGLSLEAPLYLNGTWSAPSSDGRVLPPDRRVDVVDPSADAVVARLVPASPVDVDRAVDAASDALDGWSIDASLGERADLVAKLRDLLRDGGNAERMARLLSIEAGIPIERARRRHVDGSIETIGGYVDDVKEGRFLDSFVLSWKEDLTIRYEAAGVVAIVATEGAPLEQIAEGVAPALLAGCTVIFRPLETTPLSALLFAELVHNAGFPPGTFQLVLDKDGGGGSGLGPAGERLASHPGIEMIVYSGSQTGGRRVSLLAAPTFKRVRLDAGGKGAYVVFDDLVRPGYLWDDNSAFQAAVENGVRTALHDASFDRGAPARLLVPDEYYDFALQTAKAVADGLGAGSAHEEGAHVGPVATRARFEHVQASIRSAVDGGATLVTGGPNAPEAEDFRGQRQWRLQRHFGRGYYVRPTVFADCARNTTIWNEAIPGPVLCIANFSSEDEAISLANDAPVGRRSYVFSNDATRRRKMAEGLRSGTVIVNSALPQTSSGYSVASSYGTGASGGEAEGGEAPRGIQGFCTSRTLAGLNGKQLSTFDLDRRM